MPTADRMKQLTDLYKRVLDYELPDDRVAACDFAELIQHVKLLQMEVANLGQRIEELSDLCKRKG